MVFTVQGDNDTGLVSITIQINLLLMPTGMLVMDGYVDFRHKD